MNIIPVSHKEARSFIEIHHRHNKPPAGAKFYVGLADDDGMLRGVVVAGRPIARYLDDGRTLEVTRLCTDGAVNACSMLYSAVRRAAKALGYRRLITYTLAKEPGSSLLASGFRMVCEVEGRSWSRPSRPRSDLGSTPNKFRWEISLL